MPKSSPHECVCVCVCVYNTVRHSSPSRQADLCVLPSDDDDDETAFVRLEVNTTDRGRLNNSLLCVEWRPEPKEEIRKSTKNTTRASVFTTLLPLRLAKRQRPDLLDALVAHSSATTAGQGASEIQICRQTSNPNRKLTLSLSTIICHMCWFAPQGSTTRPSQDKLCR